MHVGSAWGGVYVPALVVATGGAGVVSVDSVDEEWGRACWGGVKLTATNHPSYVLLAHAAWGYRYRLGSIKCQNTSNAYAGFRARVTAHTHTHTHTITKGKHVYV